MVKRLRGDTSFLFKLGTLSLQNSVIIEKKNVMFRLKANETLEAEFNTFRWLNVLKRFSKTGGLSQNFLSAMRAVSCAK